MPCWEPGRSPRDTALTPEEASFWLNEFHDLDQQAETREALGTSNPLLTDDEIAEIEREVEGEAN